MTVRFARIPTRQPRRIHVGTFLDQIIDNHLASSSTRRMKRKNAIEHRVNRLTLRYCVGDEAKIPRRSGEVEFVLRI